MPTTKQFYDELCARNHPAAIWFRVGEIAHSLGLFGLMISAPLFILGIANDFESVWFTRFWYSIAIMACASGSLYLGSILQKKAYALAYADGISVTAEN